MVQIGWRPDAELNMDIPTAHKTPLGTSVEMCMCGWAAWWVVSWYNLSSFLSCLQLHPTPSACPLTPPPQLQSIPMQLHYIHCWTSPRLMSDLLRSSSHAKGYHLDTLYNLSDLPSLVIMGNCLSS